MQGLVEHLGTEREADVREAILTSAGCGDRILRRARRYQTAFSANRWSGPARNRRPKAVAPGADMVLVGRRVLFGLVASGEAGVCRVRKLLADHVRRAVVLMHVGARPSFHRDVTRRFRRDQDDEPGKVDYLICVEPLGLSWTTAGRQLRAYAIPVVSTEQPEDESHVTPSQGRTDRLGFDRDA